MGLVGVAVVSFSFPFASKLRPRYPNSDLQIISFEHFRFGTVVHGLSLGSFRIGFSVWEYAVISCAKDRSLGSFRWERSLGNFRLGTFAWIILVWKHSLGNIRL